MTTLIRTCCTGFHASRKVLEIGCGSGALGHAFKRKNPNVFYVGVEFEENAAAKAKNVLDKVLCCDVEQDKLNDIIAGADKYDCIVFGDVLEHLENPEKVISRLLPSLSENGIILAFIPNVQHYTVIKRLFQGEWPLEDSGLFDKTHIRWFTKKSIIDMMKNLDLYTYDIASRIPNVDAARKFARFLFLFLMSLKLSQISS